MNVTTIKRVEELENAEEGAEWRRLPRSFTIRRRLKLTVEEFATRYHIPADLLRAWEAGSAKPDTVADAYLHVISVRPDEVAAAIGQGRPIAAE